MTSCSDPVVSWLLDGDPSIRPQTLRDLVGAAASTVERERGRAAREGWGGRLLEHRDAGVVRPHRTGAVIKPIFTRLSFPPRWRYDILRGLDHFRSVGAERDERLSDAIGLLVEKSTLERINAASRWNTLRALRVLRWWDGADGTGGSTCS